MHVGLSVCRIDPCVGRGGGGLIQVSVDPVVGLGYHICSKGVSVSRSVEESMVGQSPFINYPCEHKLHQLCKEQACKSYCSTVHFRRITSIYQPTNAHIISRKTLLKHFKTLRHVSILSDHHQGTLFLAKVLLQFSQFNSYLQTRCCGSISCCVVEQWLGVRRTTHT